MADRPCTPGSARAGRENPRGRPKGARALASVWSSVWNEKLTVTENGRRHRITKQEAAIKQLANKAASGDKHAIEAMIRFQTMLFSDPPMRRSEPPDSNPPPAETDPDKVALALLSVLRAAKTKEPSSAS